LSFLALVLSPDLWDCLSCLNAFCNLTGLSPLPLLLCPDLRDYLS
jgi:hypothetical protein